MPASEKPSYLDLLNKRVEGDLRQTVKVRVALDPDLLAELDEAKEQLAELRRKHSQKPDQPAKLDGGPLGKAQDRVTELEARILDTTLVVTLRSLNSADFLASRAKVTDDTPVNQVIKSDLTVAFQRAEDGHGHPVEDIARDDWSRLLEVIPAGELQTWHGMLGKAGSAPNFPTL